MSKQLRFSIVIPCYNEAAFIAETIDSLRRQNFGGRYEIIVVDNNCSDNTAAIARRRRVKVVTEGEAGVCRARQAGTLAAAGEIVVSTDADTVFSPDWLANIDRLFRHNPWAVAVAGSCRYKDGPAWGNLYARPLFATIGLVYRLSRRTLYASATNIAFKKSAWSSYPTSVTQGGDEVGLLRSLRRRGHIVFTDANPTYTSGRRLQKGLFYNLFVTFIYYYLLEYNLNRLLGTRLIGAAPAYRDRVLSASSGFWSSKRAAVKTAGGNRPARNILVFAVAGVIVVAAVRLAAAKHLI